MGVVMDAAALTDFLRREFPQVAEDYAIERVEEMAVTVRLRVADRHLRPGGTISGAPCAAATPHESAATTPASQRRRTRAILEIPHSVSEWAAWIRRPGRRSRARRPRRPR